MVTAIFADRGKAESAIDNLWHAGFRHDQIGILMPGGRVAEATTSTEKNEETAAQGAVAGAAAGSYAGPFVALGFSKQEADRYQRELKAGQTIVTVQTEDRAADAVAILRSHGGQTADTDRHGATGPLE